METWRDSAGRKDGRGRGSAHSGRLRIDPQQNERTNHCLLICELGDKKIVTAKRSPLLHKSLDLISFPPGQGC